MNKKEKFDISQKVMKKVANFEKRRSTSRLFELTLPIIILISIAFVFLYFSIKQIIEFGSLDGFSLFGEDFEIVKDYWRDVFSTFWQEIPHEAIITGLIFFIVAIILFVIFRKRILLFIRRLKSIRKII